MRGQLEVIMLPFDPKTSLVVRRWVVPKPPAQLIVILEEHLIRILSLFSLLSVLKA